VIACVVDASVVVKWYLPEPNSEQATSLISADRLLWAPDLVFAEVGNVYWKRVRRGELDPKLGQALTSALLASPLRIEQSAFLLEVAWDIATRHGRTIYDSLYLALAERLDVPLITADLRFHNALRDTALSERLRWIGDVS
jgi:predicted nucleic acid-binding protein